MIANVSILLFCRACLAYAGLNANALLRAYALLRANALIFPVPPSSYEDDSSQFQLTTREGTVLPAYHLPAEASQELLIYSHGNGEDIDCPILIIHGTEDRTVPFSHALRNWKRIQGPKQKLFVEGARHSNLIELAGDAYCDTVVSFIRPKTP